MPTISIIQGHPDPDRSRLCHALADAYARGAERGGHSTHRVELATLDFPLLRTQRDWQLGRDGTPESLRDAQQACVDSDHLVFIYPLWMGTMPALLKAFVEQAFRPGVALSYEGKFPKPLFKDKSARVVVTMGMPAAAYRWYFRAHSLKSFERNMLRFSGIRPVRHTLLGMVETVSQDKRESWLFDLELLGEQAR